MDNASLRNLRDFLLQYNKISQSCFLQCVNHLSDRHLSQDESGCVDMCTRKHVSVNHKVMQVYIEIQPQIVNKRIEDMNKEKAALEEAKKKELESSEKNAITDSQKPNDENENNPNKLTISNFDSETCENIFFENCC